VLRYSNLSLCQDLLHIEHAVNLTIYSFEVMTFLVLECLLWGRDVPDTGRKGRPSRNTVPTVPSLPVVANDTTSPVTPEKSDTLVSVESNISPTQSPTTPTNERHTRNIRLVDYGRTRRQAFENGAPAATWDPSFLNVRPLTGSSRDRVLRAGLTDSPVGVRRPTYEALADATNGVLGHCYGDRPQLARISSCTSCAGCLVVSCVSWRYVSTITWRLSTYSTGPDPDAAD